VAEHTATADLIEHSIVGHWIEQLGMTVQGAVCSTVRVAGGLVAVSLPRAHLALE
jgi:hypothetical protein